MMFIKYASAWDLVLIAYAQKHLIKANAAVSAILEVFIYFYSVCEQRLCCSTITKSYVLAHAFIDVLHSDHSIQRTLDSITRILQLKGESYSFLN